MLDNVRGKSALMTVLSIFSDKATLKSVHILRYKGEHGREIMNEKWLRNFQGFDKDSNYTPGKSIDTVSGATISSAALIKGIRKWSLLMDSLSAADNQTAG
ncbi:hypothetical protein BVY01_05150 [bacterium I07]|nr:hypothetical protein BVY01_05150 [bacterium I07]